MGRCSNQVCRGEEGNISLGGPAPFLCKLLPTCLRTGRRCLRHFVEEGFRYVEDLEVRSQQELCFGVYPPLSYCSRGYWLGAKQISKIFSFDRQRQYIKCAPFPRSELLAIAALECEAERVRDCLWK